MQQYPMTQKGNNNNNNKLMVAILIVLCVLAVAALIGLVWVIANNGKDDGKKPVERVEYVVVYSPEGEKLEIPEDELSKYKADGNTTKKPDGKSDVELQRYGDAVVLYNPNGGTIEVSEDDVQQYLDREGDDKYYTEPVMYIYHVSEEPKVVTVEESEEYLKTSIKGEDGEETPIEALERWYSQPVVVMYAPGDRNVVINASEEYVKQYIEAGWYQEPVAAIKKDGQEQIVKKADLEKYVADGWKEFNPKAEPCGICASDEHVTEEHPRCAYCNSTSHLTQNHPICAICGTIAHSTNGHLCTKCGSYGHDASGCNAKKCSICGQTGHDNANHPCTKCGGKGHDASSCTVKKCGICGQTGHVNAEHTCTKCGGKGHSESTCTNVKCDICGQSGHDSAGHPRCPKCGSTEHTVPSTCDYCYTQTHTSLGHPTCSWCGSKYHTPDGHNAAIAAGKP